MEAKTDEITRCLEAECLRSVMQFHRTFRVPVESRPLVPDSKRATLRVSLLQEELDELKTAIQKNDLVEVADALADLQYVLSGAVLEFGMAEKFKELFDEVHRSNMSKACETEEIAEATVKHYAKLGQPCTHYKVENQWLVYRDSDNKVLKSVEYSPADIRGILESTKENEQG